MYNIYTVLRVELCVVIGIIPGNRLLYAYACCALNQNCCLHSPKTTFQASQEFTHPSSRSERPVQNIAISSKN